jgi:hypothetical protein
MTIVSVGDAIILTELGALAARQPGKWKDDGSGPERAPVKDATGCASLSRKRSR